jgi:Transposase DDE domain
MLPLPFKLNQDRRHHIPRQRHRVTNWPAYDASLRQRGSLTVWFTQEAIAAWTAEPRTTRGGQPWYSPLAILTALTLRAVFHLAYRQAEGLIGSIIDLLGLTLRVSDHTTLSRRAAGLAVPRPQSNGPDGGAQPLHLLVDSTGQRGACVDGPSGSRAWARVLTGDRQRSCVRPHMRAFSSSSFVMRTSAWVEGIVVRYHPRRSSRQRRISLRTSHPAGHCPHHGPAFGTGELQESGTTL